MRRAAALATGAVIDRELLRSQEEVTAEIVLPDGFHSMPSLASMSSPVSMSSPAQAASVAPRHSRSVELSDSTRRDFDLALAEATEAFRLAYVRELKRRFGDDVDAAAAHAGVHPKSVSRLYRLYRIS
jgi:hypothetical protein